MYWTYKLLQTYISEFLKLYFKLKFYNSYAQKNIASYIIINKYFKNISFNFILELKFNIYMQTNNYTNNI